MIFTLLSPSSFSCRTPTLPFAQLPTISSSRGSALFDML